MAPSKFLLKIISVSFWEQEFDLCAEQGLLLSIDYS